MRYENFDPFSRAHTTHANAFDFNLERVENFKLNSHILKSFLTFLKAHIETPIYFKSDQKFFSHFIINFCVKFIVIFRAIYIYNYFFGTKLSIHLSSHI